MKTKEFIRRVESIGYKTVKTDWYINIYDKYNITEQVASVNIYAERQLSISDAFYDLAKLLIEYAETPLEEREDYEERPYRGFIPKNPDDITSLSMARTKIMKVDDYQELYDNYMALKHDFAEIVYDKYPLDEREEEKKYYVKVFNGDMGYLNVNHVASEFITSNREQTGPFQTQFTKSEIEKLKQLNGIAIDWDKVKLIEVDDDED